MKESKPLEGVNVIINIRDEKEREAVAGMLKDSGAADVSVSDNTLEMVLAALEDRSGEDDRGVLIITETEKSVLETVPALRYITGRRRYDTVAVISDNWTDEERDGLLGSADIFLTRPVERRALIPQVSVDIARKKRIMELDREFRESEESFANDKNMSFAENIIMDTLGLSKEGAGGYISSLAGKHGYDAGDAARIVYEVLLAGGKK